jgi:hypothetical protein
MGVPRCRWLGNVEIDLGELGLGGVDWIDRDQWSDLLDVIVIFRCP